MNPLTNQNHYPNCSIRPYKTPIPNIPENWKLTKQSVIPGTTAVVIVLGVVVVFVTVIFVEGLLFMEDAALLRALLLHELVVHGALFPSHLLLLGVQAEDQGFRLLMPLSMGLRGWGGRGVL